MREAVQGISFRPKSESQLCVFILLIPYETDGLM